MTWKSHIAIATAITLPFNPAALVVSNLGATAPDWLEQILKFFGIHVEHRGATHYLIVPIIIIVISFITDYKNMLFWFGVGYLSHWATDALTITGVPISPWDTSRVHFFGGKLRTGDTLEYVIAFSLLAMSITVAKPMLNFFKTEETEVSFNVFNMDYGDLNKKNVIDNKEYLERRFKFF